jgi:hypothetical protein
VTACSSDSAGTGRRRVTKDSSAIVAAMMAVNPTIADRLMFAS